MWIGWVIVDHEVRGAGEFGRALRMLAAPVTSPSAAVFARLWAARAGSLAVFLLVQWGCLAAGRRTARLAGLPAGLWVALPLGWTVAGSAAFGAALAGLARPAVLAILALVPLMPPGPEAGLPRLPRWRIPRDPVSRTSLAVLAVAVTLLTVAALAPEVQVDPLTYHYDRPLQALRLGRLVPRPASCFDLMPSLWEMILLPLFAAGGEPATRWLNPTVVILLSAGVWRLANRLTGPVWASIAAALFASNPFVAREATMAKNDLFAAALGLTAFAMLVEPGPRRRGLRGSSTIAGWLVGAAFATKYTTGGYLLPAALAALAVGRRAPKRPAWRLAAGFGAAAAPALLYGWLFTGDPVYPNAARWTGSPWFSDISAIRLREALYGITRQDPAAVSKWRNLEGAFGPGEETFMRWAVFLPALALVPRWSVPGRALLAFSAVLAAVWTTGPPPVRFGAPLFPAGAVLAVLGLAALRPRHGLLAVVLVLQLGHFLASPPVIDALRAGAGFEAPAAWRARKLSTLQVAAGAVSRLAGPRASLLLVGDSRAAVFAPPVTITAFSASAFPPFLAVHASRTPDEAWKRLRQHGWTHLVYNRLGAFFWQRSMADDPWTAADLERWAAVWRAHADFVWESPTLDLEQGYFYLWRLVPHAGRHSTAAIPGLEGWVWRMDGEVRAGRLDAGAADLASLRRAAGDYGLTDSIEARMFRARLSPDSERRLLERAVARGWRSPPVCLRLADLARQAGRPADARRWTSAALAIEPALAGQPR
jgi:hypothetical protein